MVSDHTAVMCCLCNVGTLGKVIDIYVSASSDRIVRVAPPVHSLALCRLVMSVLSASDDLLNSISSVQCAISLITHHGKGSRLFLPATCL